MAIDDQGHEIYCEVNIDQLATTPHEIMLTQNVPASLESVQAINDADPILIGPGSFYYNLLTYRLLV